MHLPRDNFEVDAIASHVTLASSLRGSRRVGRKIEVPESVYPLKIGDATSVPEKRRD
eukprot:GAFH01001941.1.p5 GENE.GAFH01001941.1~~GAFH01001941.1.p5  ORF type:complete len:57 (-),score=1.51 GAFH01001941.1:704-874(-)